MDFVTTDRRRKNMQAIRSTGSKIEVVFAKSLFARGHRYRKNDRTVFGRPDLTFKQLKIAIFIDSEFWHGKDWKTGKTNFKTNTEYWQQKIERNIERDKDVTRELKKTGWVILRFWGRQITQKLDWCILKTELAIQKRKEEIFCT